MAQWNDHIAGVESNDHRDQSHGVRDLKPPAIFDGSQSSTARLHEEIMMICGSQFHFYLLNSAAISCDASAKTSESY